MLLLKIRLKNALEVSNGPDIEEMEFNEHSEIVRLFKNFSYLTVTDTKILKHGVPIGDIYEGHTDEN